MSKIATCRFYIVTFFPKRKIIEKMHLLIYFKTLNKKNSSINSFRFFLGLSFFFCFFYRTINLGLWKHVFILLRPKNFWVSLMQISLTQSGIIQLNKHYILYLLVLHLFKLTKNCLYFHYLKCCRSQIGDQNSHQQIYFVFEYQEISSINSFY